MKQLKERLRWIVPLIASIVILLVIGCREEKQEPIIITDELVMFDADHYVILPQEPDTLHFVIIRSVDDNTIEIRCLEDSTYQTMIVESAYTPEYYPGISFTLIKGQ
jgi:hypothetical protein